MKGGLAMYNLRNYNLKQDNIVLERPSIQLLVHWLNPLLLMHR